MQRQLVFLSAVAALSLTALLLQSSDAHAQHVRVGVGVYPGGYRPYGHYGYYGRGYYPYYRPYPVVGIGIGFYAPYYGSYAYPLAPGVVYQPYPVVVGSAPATQAVEPAPGATSERPPPDNAGHLQLIVPENAEVLIDGTRISQTGKTREIVTPPLKADTRYTYNITVRHTDANGQVVNDTRAIRFQANDWFQIDFTRPPPAPAPEPVR